LIQRGKEFFALGGALIVDILFFGLTVGRSGFQSVEGFNALAGFEYWAIVLKLTVFGPFMEELFMRRYLWEIFAFLYSPPRAFLIIVCVGTAFHMYSGIALFNILSHIFASSLFTLTYIKSRRVVVPFIVHSFHNTLIQILSH